MRDLRDGAWAMYVPLRAVMVADEEAQQELSRLLAEDDAPGDGKPDGSVPLERWW